MKYALMSKTILNSGLGMLWHTPALKGVLGSRKADGLKWASKARLFVPSNACTLRRLLVANLKRLYHMLYHIECVARKAYQVYYTPGYGAKHECFGSSREQERPKNYSIGESSSTCTVLIYQGGINRLQKLVGDHPKKNTEKLLWCVNAHHEITDIPPYAVALITLLVTRSTLQSSL